MTGPGGRAGRTGSVRVRPTEIASRRAGDEVVVLDLARAVYHALNGSGALLWERMATWTTVAELTEALIGAFGLTEEQATRDVDRFVDDCAEAGLILISSDGLKTPDGKAAIAGGDPPIGPSGPSRPGG